MSENNNSPVPIFNTEFIAFIIDNKVQATMLTDERLSAIYRSHPTVIRLNDYLNGEDITIGSDFDPVTGRIIAPQPFPSWTLNENDRWVPPVPKPQENGSWAWSEEDQSWIDIPNDTL